VIVENQLRYGLALLIGFAGACGVSNRTVAVKTDAGASKGVAGTSSSSTGGRGNMSGTGGAKSTGGSGGGTRDAGGSGGTGGAPAVDGGIACDPTCSGDTPVCNNGTCGACLTGSAQCAAGDTPELCVTGAWVPQAPCSGTSPACSNGTCGSVRMSGGIITVGNAVLSAGSGSSAIRLVDHGLEYTGRICGMVKMNQVCVTGGVRP
jgi:hypothetical protein